MKLFSPMTESLRGIHAYTWGVRWLMNHKRYLFLLFLPLLIGLGVTIAGWEWLEPYRESLVQWMLPVGDPNDYIFKAIRWSIWLLVTIASLALSIISFLLLTNILASPLYELVSMAVEKDVTGVAAPEPGLWQSLKLMSVELKKALLILIISTLLLFIPVINVISFLITAFLIGWNFYDYPLARRGWDFHRRTRFVLGHFWGVMGFGLWLMIPFVQVFLMPLAIVGGTKLNLDDLKRLPEAQ